MREGWLGRTARAIDQDPATLPYATILGVLQALIGVSWLTNKHVATLVTGEDCVCWPFWAGCDRVRAVLSPGSVSVAVALYIALGLAAAALFAVRRVAAGLVAFVAAAGVGAGIYALDYRMHQNQTYIFWWLALALLFARRKAAVLQALVALVYVWAGALKLNHEWLSGAALFARPYFVPPALVPAACGYVVVMEMVLVWGLFAPWRWVRIGVFAQLLAFHAASWGVVGYFYPLLMAGVTAIYPLVWLRAPEQMLTLARLRTDGKLLAELACTGAVFSALQLVPHFFPGDPAVAGEGRLFALTMFQSRLECSGGAKVRSSSGAESEVALINDHIEVRLHCDPIILMAEARRLCRILGGRDDVTVDVAIDARRGDEATSSPLIRQHDVCRAGADYSLWRHNEWIVAR
jgi:hypothetical protein